MPGDELPAEAAGGEAMKEKDKEDHEEDHEDMDVDVEEDDGKDDDMSGRAFRSDYVGRGNVQASARRHAGLSSGFPRSALLLQEFADFMAASGSSAKDADNEVISNN